MGTRETVEELSTRMLAELAEFDDPAASFTPTVYEHVDYSTVPVRQLKQWLRQYRKNPHPPFCVAGHPDCGCTSTGRHKLSNDGWAPCSREAEAELGRRRG